jgi:hypothetical protein
VQKAEIGGDAKMKDQISDIVCRLISKSKQIFNMNVPQSRNAADAARPARPKGENSSESLQFRAENLRGQTVPAEKLA